MIRTRTPTPAVDLPRMERVAHTYNVIAILPLKSGTNFNTVSSGFQSVVVQ